MVKGVPRVPEIRSISAVTLATRDMVRAVRFHEALGFSMAYGGETAGFTSFQVGKGYLNLARAGDQAWRWVVCASFFTSMMLTPCMRMSERRVSRRRRLLGTRRGANVTFT
jgi:hypothetical protein